MKKIFDIGMYDGADSAYYLECAYHVIAVEANPELVDNAKRRFGDQIASGQLTCVNAAISPNGEAVELTLSGQDLGSSSLFSDLVAHKRPIGAITVPGVTLYQLFERYGVPEYLKVDIEGADRLCVLALTSVTRVPLFCRLRSATTLTSYFHTSRRLVTNDSRSLIRTHFANLQTNGVCMTE